MLQTHVIWSYLKFLLFIFQQIDVKMSYFWMSLKGMIRFREYMDHKF